ncbi:MAG: hypothetical protein H3C47_02815 [Candidatus Cloacimonetes bacterium]|nr:hypothetical protein [Candidatus Cloacimonadota bacterium]
MKPKSEEFRSALSNIRERIATAKRYGTNRGFIDYRGCVFVCNELTAILEDAEKSIKAGHYAFTYSVAALVLINCAKLASFADDSAGGVTDTCEHVKMVLDNTCSAALSNSEEAEYIFTQALKDAQNKALEGWDEFAYYLLVPTAQLATQHNVQKLYMVLDAFNARLALQEYCAWHLEYDSLVRLAAKKAVENEDVVQQFIEANTKYDSIRKIAIRNALDKKQFALAETLCIDKIDHIKQKNQIYFWAKEWYELLFEVYTQSDNRLGQIELARDLLVAKQDTKYYPILKNLLIEKGTWQSVYPALLLDISKKLPSHLYMEILSKEQELDILLEQVKSDPGQIFAYGKQLSVKFPQETYALCLDQIRMEAVEANTRPKYTTVCNKIKKLFEFKGVAEAQSIITELKAKYPRRPAMVEELNTILKRLGIKGA